MLITNADRICLGQNDAKRVFLGENLVWPVISGNTDPDKTIMYVLTDQSGNTLNEGLCEGLRPFWSLEENVFYDYFKTTEGLERPYYNKNGLMLFDGDLTTCWRPFSDYWWYGDEYMELPPFYIDILHLPDTLTNVYGIFNRNNYLRSITLPPGVENIGYAFDQCHNLSGLTIPDGVTQMDATVTMCRRMTYLSIPASVQSMRWGEFNRCFMLENVNFRGTIAQWNAMKYYDMLGNEVQYDIANTETGVRRIICTDGTITL